MTAPASTVVVVVLLLYLHQIFAFQVPLRRLPSNDLREFRVPRTKQLRRYMNKSVDPCVDFYEFACGNWPIYHPVTEDDPIASPLQHLQDKVYEDLQDIFEEPVSRYDVGRKAKDFYASCTMMPVPLSMRTILIDFFNKYGGMPAVVDAWSEHNYYWLTQVTNLRTKFGMDILIGLEIKQDHQNQRDAEICIGEPSTIMPKSLCKETDFNDSQYENLQKEVIDNMVYWFDINEIDAKKLAADIFDFEKSLCRGMSSKAEDGLDAAAGGYSRKSLMELNQQHPSIDFEKFVTTSFGQPIPLTVYITNEDYFTNLAKVIRTTPKRVVANYIMYRALAILDVPKEEDLEKRKRLCVEKSVKYFPKIVGDLYHRKHFRPEIVSDVEQLWDKLREAFKMDINTQLWIEETTRRQAIYKLTGTQLKFPTYVRDVLQNEYNSLKIDKSQFWKNIQNLLEMQQKAETNKLFYDNNARNRGSDIESSDLKVIYSPPQNIIRIPLALLQPPVYHRGAPNAYKYGVLGSLIAHELVHGFDEQGWNYDGTSTMRFWWDYNSTLLYKEQVKCFKEQYVSNVGEDESVPALEFAEQIREIVANNAALNISFNAYLIWLQTTSDTQILYDETLSDVDYTNTQLFFLAYAQNYCLATYEEEPPVGYFSWDASNRVERFRVNGPLMNMREFAREFNCSPGTDMNPADKCVIY